MRLQNLPTERLIALALEARARLKEYAGLQDDYSGMYGEISDTIFEDSLSVQADYEKYLSAIRATEMVNREKDETSG